MNYYAPYFGYVPYATAPASRGILGGILSSIRGVNWSGMLSNIQKTLGVVNQAIPMVKQVSPMIGNAKTMFKIMNEFKKVDTPVNGNIQKSQSNNKKVENLDISKQNIISESPNQPTFFI